jgi:hypothetical protein
MVLFSFALFGLLSGERLSGPQATVIMLFIILDGFVTSPDAALRFILRHCGVRKSTPHSSGFARLACGLFTKPSHFRDF